MTQRLKEQLTANMGESTGPTKYAQLKEMLRALDLLSADRIKYIPQSLVELLNNWTDQQWEEAVSAYRQKTTAMVKLNVGSLPQIKQSVQQSLE